MSNVRAIRKSVYLELLAVSTLFGLVLFVFSPGSVTSDSLAQLEEAVAGSYHPAHPPLMAFVWSLTNKIAFGPVGMLWFHGVFLAAGLWLLARTLFDSVWARIAFILGIGFFPPTFVQFAMIWKDVGVVMGLLCAAACLAIAQHAVAMKGKLLGSLAAMIFLMYACGVRYNAPPAAVPFCFWIGSLLFERKSKKSSRIPSFVVSSFVFFVVVSIPSQINRRLSEDVPAQYQHIQLSDLAAISQYTGRNLLPAGVQKRKNFDPTVTQYCASDFGTRPHFLFQAMDATQEREINDLWISSLLHYPWPYFSCRWLLFREFLGIERNKSPVAYFRAGVESRFGRFANPNFASTIYFRFLNNISESIFFHNYLYFGTCLWMVLYCWFARVSDPLFRAVAWSGFMYFLTYFVSAPSGDFRYIYWSVIASYVCTFWVGKSVIVGSRKLVPRRQLFG